MWDTNKGSSYVWSSGKSKGTCRQLQVEKGKENATYSHLQTAADRATRGIFKVEAVSSALVSGNRPQETGHGVTVTKDKLCIQILMCIKNYTYENSRSHFSAARQRRVYFRHGGSGCRQAVRRRRSAWCLRGKGKASLGMNFYGVNPRVLTFVVASVTFPTGMASAHWVTSDTGLSFSASWPGLRCKHHAGVLCSGISKVQ